MPFIKTVFYYYVTRRYGTDLDPEGIYLTDTPVFPDENTVPEKETEITPQGAAAGPAALKNQIYRLSQSPDVQDDIRTEYRFTTDAARFMELCRANGTSPNAMVSSLLARAVWREDPQLKEDVVINLCVDMRTALECPHNHSNLTTCVPIIFDASMKDISLPEICAGARKTMIAGARPEIIRSVYEKSAAQADKIQRIKKEDLKKKVMQSHLHGPGGFFNCTVLLSYWGPNSLESLEPYIKGLFTTIDFIPEGGMAVEFSCKGEKFCFSFMQDFSSDAYAGLFKHELEELGLKVENEVRMPMPAIRIDLPC